MNLNSLALIVRSNFKRLTESEIVGRIMLVANRNLERSLKGYQMLKAEKHLTGFIEPKTDGKFIAMLEKYPALSDLIERLDCVPGKMEITAAKIPAEFRAPEKLTPDLVRNALKLPDL